MGYDESPDGTPEEVFDAGVSVFNRLAQKHDTKGMLLSEMYGDAAEMFKDLVISDPGFPWGNCKAEGTPKSKSQVPTPLKRRLGDFPIEAPRENEIRLMSQ